MSGHWIILVGMTSRLCATCGVCGHRGFICLCPQEEEKARAEKAESSAPREEQEEGIEDLMALADLKLGGAAVAADQLPKGAHLPVSHYCHMQF